MPKPRATAISYLEATSVAFTFSADLDVMKEVIEPDLDSMNEGVILAVDKLMSEKEVFVGPKIKEVPHQLPVTVMPTRPCLIKNTFCCLIFFLAGLETD